MNLNDILASSFSQIALSGHGASAYLIPNIPRKVLSKAWRTFCPQEARESILAVIDTSFFKNGKEGLVFTQNALYIKEPIHRVHQFVYRDIDAVIYCLRNSHKGIIIGKNGSMLKRIGTYAREDLEKMLGEKVNLRTWVKVRKDWQDEESIVKKFKIDN